MWHLHDIPVQEAARMAGLFQPSFEERHGCIFLAGQSVDPDALGTDRTGAEAFANHLHILDLFTHSAAADGGERDNTGRYTRTCADYAAASTLGKALAWSWFFKLKSEYPRHRFRVYYTERDNPVVRFHGVRVNEPVWLSESDWSEAIAKGEVLVLDTEDQRGRTGRLA